MYPVRTELDPDPERDQGCGADTGPSRAKRGGGGFKAVGDPNSRAIRGERQRRRRPHPARAATDGVRDVPLVEKELELDPEPRPGVRSQGVRVEGSTALMRLGVG